MSSRSKRLALGGAVAILLLVLFFRGVDGPALLSAFRSADPRFLAGVVLVTIVTYAVRSWRWGYLLAPLVHVGFARLFSATIIGFTTGLVVPRAGEVVRPYLIGRHHAIPTSAAFASIILERLADLFTVILLFTLYLYVLPAPAAQQGGALLGMLKKGGALVAAGALAALALLVALRLRADRMIGVLDRMLRILPARMGTAISRAVRSFAEGLGVLQAPVLHLLAIAGQSLLLWLGIALGVYFTNRAFGLDLPFHTTFLILGFLTIGVAVPTPGMVGGFHESYLLALTRGFGVSKDVAAAAGIASHALTNIPVLVLGLFFLGREGLTVGKVAEIAERHP